MKKLFIGLVLMIVSGLSQAMPDRYADLNLTPQQSRDVEQIVNRYEQDIQRTLVMIHNNGVSLNQMSRIPTTKENRIAKAQQLSMLSEGSGFLSNRLGYLLNERDKSVMSVLTPQQVDILSRMPRDDITLYTGGNHIYPIR